MAGPSKYDQLRAMREEKFARRAMPTAEPVTIAPTPNVTQPEANVTRRGGRAKVYVTAAAKQRAYRERKAMQVAADG